MAYSRNFDGESNGAVTNYANGVLSGSAVVTVDNTVFYGGSGKSLKISNGSANIGNNWQYDSATELNSGDGTYTFSARMGTTNDASACRVGFLFRGDSGGTTGYVAMFRPQASSATVRLSRYSGTTETAIVTANYDVGATFVAGDWYNMKVFTSGTTIRVRAWKDGDSEPGTWLIDTTDATYDNTNKKAGYFTFTSVIASREVWVDSFLEAGGAPPVTGASMFGDECLVY